MKVYFAADHAGFELKKELLVFVRESGYETEDCGAFELDPSDDYPEIIACAARAVSNDVAQGLDSRAIVIGASGQGEAMAANRFKGVRAAVYYGPAAHSQKDTGGKSLDLIASIREHNDANVLSLGARFISGDEAKAVAGKWLSKASSGEERHARRARMLDTIN